MPVRHQRGHLRCVARKNGPTRWEFLWRETDATGKRVRRNAVIGSIEEYPTEASAQAATNGLRTCINENRNRQHEQPVSVADLIDHYIETELAETSNWHSHATRIVYREYLTRWIKPCWASINIRDVRTIAVEKWLRELQRQNGEVLANSTKAKVRNLMSVLFNHAIRYEWLEQGKNPITLARQSASRQLTPEVLEAHEIQSLLAQLDSPFQIMVLLDITTGLRRSELFALKWGDVDFWNLTIDINRSIFQGVIGNCKTAASRRPVPLSLDVAADLWLWKERTDYSKPDDWIFASPWGQGQQAILAQHSATEGYSPCGSARWHQEKNRLAYIPAYLFNDAYCEWGECEGGPGTDETRKQPLHPGCLYASEDSSETRRPTTSCTNDSARGAVEWNEGLTQRS